MYIVLVSYKVAKVIYFVAFIVDSLGFSLYIIMSSKIKKLLLNFNLYAFKIFY